VEFEDGSRERYFLPLTVCAYDDVKGLEERSPNAILAHVTGARKGVLFDAWLDDRYARTLLDALEREERIATKRGSVRALKTAAFAGIRGGAGEDLRITRMVVDQSNTSVVYGDRLILKLFRRLQAGINPDYEIGRQLTERAGFTRVPPVAGAFEYTGLETEPSTLAMMQQLVHSQGDGWAHTLDEIARFYEDLDAEAAPSGGPAAGPTYTELIASEPPERVVRAMGSYLGTAATLGRRTAEMHLALAADTRNPAFAPEPLTQVDLERWSATAAAQAQTAFDTLSVTSLNLPADLKSSAHRLRQSRETLLERIRSVAHLEFVASKIRVHGDYHLGQVLWCEEDFVILDFEGEPARPIVERRLKQSPLKDVAGMMRSFSYAAYAGLFVHVTSRPAELDRIEPWARIWQRNAAAAFLRSYFTTAAGALFVPAADSQRDALLQFFVLDKALYELDYELNNRPDWVRIPLRGIFELLNAPS
jgi:maltose alpha-D-glucosyltransferase/alpha-amylase